MAVLLAMTATANAQYFQFVTNVNIESGFIPVTSVVTDNPVGGGPAPKLTTPLGTPITLLGRKTVGFSVEDNLQAQGAGTNIVFGNVKVEVNKDTQLEAGIEIPYTFHVLVQNFLADDDPGFLGSVTFDVAGVLKGSVGAGKSVIFTNTYLSPLTQQATIPSLNLKYQLTLNPNIVAPGPFVLSDIGPEGLGALGANIRIIPNVPEPSTMVLLGFASLGLATPALRRLRRKKLSSGGSL